MDFYWHFKICHNRRSGFRRDFCMIEKEGSVHLSYQRSLSLLIWHTRTFVGFVSKSLLLPCFSIEKKRIAISSTKLIRDGKLFLDIQEEESFARWVKMCHWGLACWTVMIRHLGTYLLEGIFLVWVLMKDYVKKKLYYQFFSWLEMSSVLFLATLFGNLSEKQSINNHFEWK